MCRPYSLLAGSIGVRVMNNRLSSLIWAVSLALCLPEIAAAAKVSGKVLTVDGKAIAGAIVTLWNTEKTQKFSVYSDSQGSYRFKEREGGE